MTALARKLEDAFDVLINRPRQPDPANDNRHCADFATYARNVQAQAGAAYQGPGAKMWWVP